MIQWIKCLFGFHSYTEWVEREVTAGLGSVRYQTRACLHCDHVHYHGLE